MSQNDEDNAVNEELIQRLDTLTFDGDITDHVQLLINLPEEVFKDFCRLALDYLQNGPNEKRYNTAADKLETSVEAIVNAVRGIVYLLINACKYKLNDDDFMSTLTELQFSESNSNLLIKFLNAKKNNIKSALAKFNVDLPTYHDLEWRLEAQIASRSLPEQIIPSVLLNFAYTTYDSVKICRKHEIGGDRCDDSCELEEPSKSIKNTVLRCDLGNLDNLISNVETALRETKNYQAKKTKAAITKE